MSVAPSVSDGVVDAAMTPLAAARFYTAHGWRVVPVSLREKKPSLMSWQRLRLDDSELDAYFKDEPGCANIGILLGEPSGHLVDVDIDCAEALELADEYLPPTGAKTGRPGAPTSHWWYIAPGAKSKQHKEPSVRSTELSARTMIVELRSTGLHTLVGPSIHPSGEPYDVLEGDPASVDANYLAACVERLAAVVNERRHGCKANSASSAQTPIKRSAPAGDMALRRAEKYLDKMEPSISGQGGHDRAYAAATAMVHGFGLDPDIAMRLLSERFNPRCQPPWTERELHHKIEDAATKPHNRPYRWILDQTDVGRGSSHMKGDARRTDDCERSSKPQVVLGPDEHRVIDEVVEALANDETVFQRGGVLVEALPIAQAGHSEAELTIAPMDPPRLRDVITRDVEILKLDNKCNLTSAHPTTWLVGGVASRRTWPGVRPIAGVSRSPLLRPDGTIAQAHGYDAATGVLIAPMNDFAPIGDEVGELDALAARDRLLELVCDFPFASDAYRSGFIAGLLTPIARHAFSGPAPLFLVDANTRGAGKTLLVQVIARIALGREIATSGYTHDSAECRKQITTLAITGEPMALLDNLPGVIGNDAIDRALTTTRWRDRVLGSNAQIDVPLKLTWFATGNNTTVTADTARRVVHIRLESDHEKPEDRSDFQHTDLLAHVEDLRSELYRDAMTVLRGYYSAGRPDMKLRPMGSFTGWSNLVRSTVVWCGLPDPCSTRDELEVAADTNRELLCLVIDAFRAWDPDGRGIVIAEAIRNVYQVQGVRPADEPGELMRAALEALGSSRPGVALNVRTIGNRLRGFKGRVVNGLRLDCVPGRRSGGREWLVREVGP